MFINNIMFSNYMTLREVKPLSKRQWKQVANILKAGPTPEQKRLKAEAVELAKQIREEKD